MLDVDHNVFSDDVPMRDGDGLATPEVLGTPGARPFNATEKMVAFAVARHRGHNQTESARLAGYSGDDRVLQSTGSRLASNPKVIALLKILNEGEEDDPVGDIADLRKLLWREARNGANSTSKLKAMELLSRYEWDRLDRDRELNEATKWAIVDRLAFLIGVDDTNGKIALARRIGLDPERRAA